ncbi:hypothetical protein VTN77DRAFT_5159 [Rasamsonia byssochlamydoides]|uniref:uncharacterized protein n=1 Tax=Rasamsonia byssochlamydoides TaxID=89139 RepID=UPI0037444B3C
MFIRNLLLAASVASLAQAAPFEPTKTFKAVARAADATGEKVTKAVAVKTINDNDGVGAGKDTYTQYNGDGSTAAGWPSQSEWVSFDDMFNANKAIMQISCTQFGQENDSEAEIEAIRTAIEQVAAQTYVDHRFILAIIMQESKGCVRVPTTFGAVANPGLMQDHDGAASCNNGGAVQNPCPNSTITQMISEGTAGTSTGDGLANCLNEAPGTSAQAFYQAARIYNSGSIASSGDLGAGVATHCYVSDVANRLTGWVNAPHGCNLD